GGAFVYSVPSPLVVVIPGGDRAHGAAPFLRTRPLSGRQALRLRMTHLDRLSCLRFRWRRGWALAFVFWKILDRSQRQGARFRRVFTCPFRGRAVIAEFQRDSAERSIDVVWCTAFRPAVVVKCRKQCLRMQRILQSASREPWGEFGLLHTA